MLSNLLLLRHAKSDWHTGQTEDFDRPLSSRGRKAATRMGIWMRENVPKPQKVLSSPARRAVQTTNRIAKVNDLESVVEWVDAIYEASVQTLLALVDDQHRFGLATVLIVGHNPGLEDLISALVGEIPVTMRAEKLFPSAALAHIKFDGERRHLMCIQRVREI